ncbi:hypothetical protein CKM354_000612500 [Cercospora kikuchii]|uniref:Uncharacterized protein n=1 Tax=Cercospora kikuchii TaxID=84275 RepID=A0A9P3CIT6_9PEZI|nr:uncharacterized protein CKM354_000612500 [Cercospora kikuchii]GIZ42876.1 hypothetical protein CKM354_000612500 [Cercospora kikuchii]
MRFRKRANPTQNTAPQLPGEALGRSDFLLSVTPTTDSEHPPSSGRGSAREHFRHPHITLKVSMADPHGARIADMNRLDRFDLRHALVMSTGPKHYIEELTFKTEENHQKLPKLDQFDGEPAEILADFFAQLPNLRQVNLQMLWSPAQALFLDVLAIQPQLQLTQLVIHAPTYKPAQQMIQVLDTFAPTLRWMNISCQKFSADDWQLLFTHILDKMQLQGLGGKYWYVSIGPGLQDHRLLVKSKSVWTSPDHEPMREEFYVIDNQEASMMRGELGVRAGADRMIRLLEGVKESEEMEE